MRTAEYLNALQTVFEDNVCIESLETQTEWSTTYYAYTVYIWDLVYKDLSEDDREIFQDEGIAPFLDRDGVVTDESFDEAIHELFYYCYEKGLLE